MPTYAWLVAAQAAFNEVVINAVLGCGDDGLRKRRLLVFNEVGTF
jgi:hypothetical protein